MRDGRRLCPRYVHARHFARIRPRTAVVGCVDGAAEYRAELRRLARLNTVEHDLIAVHDVVETQVPHCCVPCQLVNQVATQRLRPSRARSPRQSNSYAHPDTASRERLALRLSNDRIALRHASHSLGKTGPVRQRTYFPDRGFQTLLSVKNCKSSVQPLSPGWSSSRSARRQPWSACPSTARSRSAPQLAHSTRSGVS